MAITIESKAENSISLEEYIEYVSTNVDINDLSSVLASADQLKKLTNNRHFLLERFNSELKNWKSFQPTNLYSSQALTLGSGKGFLVRANMWMPPSEVPDNDERYNNLFSYLVPHDHNFSFMTIGYLGSGYGTTIYEYSPEEVIGYPGEKVKLRFLEKTSLPQGKIMFYRASKDIHSQEHPDEFSISLNLLLVKPELNSNNQYLFDFERGIIQNYVHAAARTRIVFCYLARYIGNNTTINLLESLAMQSVSPYVRVAAYDSLASLEKGSATKIWQQALEDKHGYVQLAAQTALQKLEN